MNLPSKKVIEFHIKETTYRLCRVTSDRAIYDLWKNSLKIEDDGRFYIAFFLSLRGTPEDLNLAQIYVALTCLCGESDGFFDDWKGSFSFFFCLTLLKNNQQFDYLLDIRDFRGSLEFSIRRCLKLEDSYDKHRVYPPFEAEFSREEINYFISYLYGYILGYFQASQKICNYNQPFLKKIASNLIIYGYKDGQFYEEQYDDEDAYQQAIASRTPEK